MYFKTIASLIMLLFVTQQTQADILAQGKLNSLMQLGSKTESESALHTSPMYYQHYESVREGRIAKAILEINNLKANQLNSADGATNFNQALDTLRLASAELTDELKQGGELEYENKAHQTYNDLTDTLTHTINEKFKAMSVDELTNFLQKIPKESFTDQYPLRHEGQLLTHAEESMVKESLLDSLTSKIDQESTNKERNDTFLKIRSALSDSPEFQAGLDHHIILPLEDQYTAYKRVIKSANDTLKSTVLSKASIQAADHRLDIALSGIADLGVELGDLGANKKIPSANRLARAMNETLTYEIREKITDIKTQFRDKYGKDEKMQHTLNDLLTAIEPKRGEETYINKDTPGLLEDLDKLKYQIRTSPSDHFSLTDLNVFKHETTNLTVHQNSTSSLTDSAYGSGRSSPIEHQHRLNKQHKTDEPRHLAQDTVDRTPHINGPRINGGLEDDR